MTLSLLFCPLCRKGYWREPTDAPPCCWVSKDHRPGLLTAEEMVILGEFPKKAKSDV